MRKLPVTHNEAIGRIIESMKLQLEELSVKVEALDRRIDIIEPLILDFMHKEAVPIEREDD
jgi:hypothetical protein